MSNKSAPLETHPSYGVAQLLRVNGRHGPLFGSALEEHYGTVKLTINRASVQHEYGQDRFFGEERLIEVELSMAQLAEFITTWNQSPGIPCTVRFVKGEGLVPDPPARPTEAELSRGYLKRIAADMAQQIANYTSRVEKLCEKLPKKAQEEIRREADVMLSHFKSNLPFVVQQYQEVMDRMTSTAKTEAESFMIGMLQRAGLAALHEHVEKLQDGGAAPSLPSGEDD